MKFWDSSGIVPLLVAESTTESMLALYKSDPDIIVWWGAEVECASALARLERSGELSAAAIAQALRRLKMLRESWQEIQPVDELRESAKRFLRVHHLRAADALQLAAALLAAEGRPSTLEVVCLDDRLTDALQREGFQLVDVT